MLGYFPATIGQPMSMARMSRIGHNSMSVSLVQPIHPSSNDI